MARFFLLTVSALSAFVAIAVVVSGGFSFTVGSVLVRAHRPWVAASVALVSAVLAGWLDAPSYLRPALRAAWDRRDRVATWLAATAACTVLIVGFVWGDSVAGSADSYGYVSQALLWARGDITTANPIALESPWPAADWTFSPLGYRPALVPGVSVPTYPPGLPLVMAVVVRCFGPNAVFWVVPLLGALAVWSAYHWARAAVGPVPGAMTAILLAASPVFLFQLFQPMSDVPVTAWWVTSLALMTRGRFLGAGLCAGLALLTRPNLTPLGLYVVPWVAYEAYVRARTRGAAARAVLEFGVPFALALAFVLTLSYTIYGDPFMSGYGAARDLFGLKNIPANLARYPVWLWQTQTPFVYLALGAPILAWLAHRGRRSDAPNNLPAVGRVLWSTGFAAVVVGCYLVYFPFEEWWYLRFLLPALPILLALAAWVALRAIGTLAMEWRAPLTVVVILALASIYVQTAREGQAFALQEVAQRYVKAGRYAAEHLPPRSVFICVQHSGSLRFYGGGLTLRWDWLDPTWLDRTVDHLRRAGYHPYFALEIPEEDAFRERFSAASPLGRLDWPALADLRQKVVVRFYDPLARARFRKGEPIDSTIVRPNGGIIVRSRSTGNSIQ
ncbi:MAG: hypothetical protein NT151_01130 [Acidobacteria bacterium]|nr:hypothetical protein [Acidobacteriota bacterium]